MNLAQKTSQATTTCQLHIDIIVQHEAHADLFDYIERFYNPRRKHSTLGNISPAEFERRFGSLVQVSGETGET